MPKTEKLYIKSDISNIEVFEKFCSFIETVKANSIKEFFKSIQPYLLSIYESGLKLSSNHISSDNDYPSQLSDIEFESRLKFIADLLGDDRYYWETFNPLVVDDRKSVCGDLVDDIGDIYKDIKESLLLLSIDNNEAKEMAMWQFQFQFSTHWGDHCIDALRACHYILKE